jgi:hypothetical protein
MKARHAILVAPVAAATMVALVGVTLVSPSSTASASAQPGSSPNAVRVGVAPHSLVAAACAPAASLMCAARLTVTEDGVRFSFTRRPGGWKLFSSISTDKSPAGPISLNRDIVESQSAEAIIYWTSFPDGDYADPCTRLLGRSVGSSAADLAAAVSNAPGTKLVKGPSNVTLGGRPAKHVALIVRKQVGCEPGFFYTWKDVNGGALWPRTVAGDTIRVWIVAVGGTRLFIAAATNERATAGLKREVRQIVESIRFA